MSTSTLLRSIKSRLLGLYGGRLAGVVLYGSEARGEAGPDSDIDVLVLIDEVQDYGEAVRRIIDALYPLSARERRFASEVLSQGIAA